MNGTIKVTWMRNKRMNSSLLLKEILSNIFFRNKVKMPKILSFASKNFFDFHLTRIFFDLHLILTLILRNKLASIRSRREQQLKKNRANQIIEAKESFWKKAEEDFDKFKFDSNGLHRLKFLFFPAYNWIFFWTFWWKFL